MNMRAHRTAVLALAMLVLSGATAAQETAHKTRRTVSGHQVVLRSDAPAVSPITQVRSLYYLYCAGCHGASGQGLYGAQVPDLRPVGAFLGLPGGRQFLLRVPGVMGSGLDDAQVATVLNWMLHNLAEPVPVADAFTAAEVAQARAQPLIDVMQERRRLLQQAEQQGLRLAPLGHR